MATSCAFLVITKITDSKRLDYDRCLTNCGKYKDFSEIHYSSGLDSHGVCKQLPKGSVLHFYDRLFEVGEIIIVEANADDPTGWYEREIVGRKRSPHKWDVEYRSFKTIEEAILFSQSLDF